MRTTPNILGEYEYVPIKQSRFHIPIVILFSIFFCFLIADMFMNIENLSWKGLNIDWINILLSVIIPGTGLSFFIARKRIGWFISTTFFSFIAFAAIATIIYSTIIKAGFTSLLDLKVRQLFIIITSTTISTFLQTKSIRVFFQIKNPIWLIAITISLCLTFALILLG